MTGTGELGRIRRTLLMVLGILCVVLALVGILVPILPTTPLLLLAATLFLRSSPRLHKWLLYHPVFGKFIRYYRRYRAVPLHSKVLALVLLWGTILASVFFWVESVWLQAGLLGIAAAVSRHILSLRTLTQAMLGEICSTEQGGLTAGEVEGSESGG